METLVVMSQHHHRNQYYSSNRCKPQGSYCSSPSKDFRVLNCKTFQRGNGILPTPFKSYAYSSPLTTRASSTKISSHNQTLFKTSSLKSTPIPINAKACKKDTTLIEGLSDNRTLRKITPQSTLIPINGKAYKKDTAFSDGSLLLSELWAGPTYSNSPPPSSLPIPKFSVTPSRTVSLDLPGSSPEIEMHYPISKSALSSPHMECSSCMLHLFVNDVSATKMLCRILNLNLNDE